jgi:hypothetical protein
VAVGQRVRGRSALELYGLQPLEEIGHVRASSMAG